MLPIVTHEIWRLGKVNGKVKCPKFLYISVFSRSHKFIHSFIHSNAATMINDVENCGNIKWSRAMESSTEIPQNLIIQFQYDPATAFMDIYSKEEKEERDLSRSLYSHVHNSIVHNS